MAVEIERYIVELGAEGRLIEMQLEEMLRRRRRRPALVRDYLVDYSRGASRVMETLPRLPHQDLLDFGRLGELLGYDRKLNTLDFPSPRAATGSSGASRAPELVVENVVREFGAST
jgi:diadenylate cyclase